VNQFGHSSSLFVTEIVMFTDAQKELAAEIGAFYLEKNQGDYVATEKEISALHITNVETKDGKAYISTGRPGLLIGKRGQNIDLLSKWLKKPVHIIEVESLLPYLVPVLWDDL